MFCNRIEHAVPDRSYDNVNQGMPAWLTTATLEIHHSHYSVLSRYFHNHSWVVFQLVFAQQTSHQLVHLTCCYFHLLKQLSSLQSLRNAEHLWHSENKGNCNPQYENLPTGNLKIHVVWRHINLIKRSTINFLCWRSGLIPSKQSFTWLSIEENIFSSYQVIWCAHRHLEQQL